MPPKRRGAHEQKPFPIPDKIPNDPAALLELLRQIPNMNVQDMMEMERKMDTLNSCSPFPSKRAKKLITRIQAARHLNEIQENDIWSLFGLTSEDFYMESAMEVGAPGAFLHVLTLCTDFAQERMDANVKTALSESIINIRKLSVFGLAEGLLNQNNKRNADLDPIREAIIPIILQDTPIREGFPVDITTINFAIKALAETITAYGTQHRIDPVNFYVVHNPELLMVIRTYIRNELIGCPLASVHSFMQVSSLLCTTRFVMGLGMTTPHTGIYHMREHGFLDALESVAKHMTNQYDSLTMVRESIKILNFLPPDQSVTAPVCPHTKTQVRRLCDYCAAPEKPSDPLKVCASCKQRRYCNRDCQIAHWKAIHGAECKQLQAQKSSQ